MCQSYIPRSMNTTSFCFFFYRHEKMIMENQQANQNQEQMEGEGNTTQAQAQPMGHYIDYNQFDSPLPQRFFRNIKDGNRVRVQRKSKLKTKYFQAQMSRGSSESPLQSPVSQSPLARDGSGSLTHIGGRTHEKHKQNLGSVSSRESAAERDHLAASIASELFKTVGRRPGISRDQMLQEIAMDYLVMKAVNRTLDKLLLTPSDTEEKKSLHSPINEALPEPEHGQASGVDSAATSGAQSKITMEASGPRQIKGKQDNSGRTNMKAKSSRSTKDWSAVDKASQESSDSYIGGSEKGRAAFLSSAPMTGDAFSSFSTHEDEDEPVNFIPLSNMQGKDNRASPYGAVTSNRGQASPHSENTSNRGQASPYSAGQATTYSDITSNRGQASSYSDVETNRKHTYSYNELTPTRAQATRYCDITSSGDQGPQYPHNTSNKDMPVRNRREQASPYNDMTSNKEYTSSYDDLTSTRENIPPYHEVTSRGDKPYNQNVSNKEQTSPYSHTTPRGGSIERGSTSRDTPSNQTTSSRDSPSTYSDISESQTQSTKSDNHKQHKLKDNHSPAQPGSIYTDSTSSQSSAT